MITFIGENVVWYDYKGDEIAWNGNQYVSLLTEGYFDTLESMDKFWEEYFKQ